MKQLATDNIEELLEKDRFVEGKIIHKIFLYFSVVYMAFGIADFFYASEKFWQFLALRAVYCLVPISIYFVIDRTKSFRQTEYFAFVHAGIAAGIISYMIFSTSGVNSPYYAGLNLVGLIGLCFFTFSWSFFWLTTGVIYLPYYLLSFAFHSTTEVVTPLILNSFFIVGTLFACAVIHYFREKFRLENVKAKFQLRQELENRNEIIQKKTDEAVRLNSLYSQFSPQIVESIRSGNLKLEAGGQRAQICAIFIDIVNSTERVTRIDKDKVEKVLSKFLDDSIKILLKYDITIDKFLGDGILAFCNAPLKRVDYVSRVVKAGLEIRHQINQDQEFFERYWQAPLDIRIGIAKGFVNVGFYGSQKHFRSYTAIGPVVNLASRLCSSAEPNQLLVDYDVYDEVKDEFESSFLGKKSLKGFENDVIHVYEIKSSRNLAEKGMLGISECPTCGGLLTLETNALGQFVFMCKACCAVIDTDKAVVTSTAKVA